MSKLVAVLTPVYHEELAPEEKISLGHLRHFLSSYDRYFIVPKGLQLRLPGFERCDFDPHFFTHTDAYSKLLLSPQFYEKFSDYEYILIYQLDCLVFSDQLAEWCRAGYDYIGAPLFRNKDEPQKGFSRVGNGGLSLRKVESFLKVLDSKRYEEEEVSYWKQMFTVPLKDLERFPIPGRWLKKTKVLRDARRGVGWYASLYTLNEDLFWSDRAKLFYPEFNIAPIDVALRFAFEAHPRYCFEQNNCQLPFGCHAWAKWDRAFWEPYLIKAKNALSQPLPNSPVCRQRLRRVLS